MGSGNWRRRWSQQSLAAGDSGPSEGHDEGVTPFERDETDMTSEEFEAAVAEGIPTMVVISKSSVPTGAVTVASFVGASPNGGSVTVRPPVAASHHGQLVHAAVSGS